MDRLLTNHIAERLALTAPEAKKLVPEMYERWSKVEMQDGGDLIRALNGQDRRGGENRDASFIQVSQFRLLIALRM
jgi:hypothetical protein